jgi:DNA topoisomerase VI subunit B
MTTPNLNRTQFSSEHFSVAIGSEYFDPDGLRLLTGQVASGFGEVIIKELLDNSLDACETMRVEPDIVLGYAFSEDRMRIAVSDNGGGLGSEVIRKIMDFTSRTSDKIAYKEPSRGLQGNALKTIIGITDVLGGGKVTIESRGMRHEIIARATPIGRIHIDHVQTPIAEQRGTAVYVDLPRCEINTERWL